MLTLSIPVLTQVVNTAMQSAANHPRWLNAINRAVAELHDNPYISRQDDHLLIASSSSDGIYSSNGICQCTSYTGIDPKTGRRVHQGGQPCWHRAAARLVRLHDEAQATVEHRASTAQVAERLIAAVAAPSLADRIAAQRKAQAELDECFA